MHRHADHEFTSRVGAILPNQTGPSSHFEGRGPGDLLEPWRYVAVGPFGIAAMRFEALDLASFSKPPRAYRGEGYPKNGSGGLAAWYLGSCFVLSLSFASFVFL